jgi:ABC-type branched-subunit amino acid transport system substrate-binding protein
MKGKAVTIAIILVLSSTLFFAVPLKAQGTLTIGIIGPYGIPHWGGPYSPLTCGMWEGASLAAMEINGAGGIDVGGTTYTISLEPANENSIPTPNPTAAYDEFVRLLDVEGCEYIVGAFRTEVTQALISASVDYYSLYPHLFLINGASTTELINGTIPQLFRINPINSTALFRTIGGAIGAYMLYASPPLPALPVTMPGQGFMWNIFKDPTVLGNLGNETHPIPIPQVRIAVLTEDLDWTSVMHTYLTVPSIYPAVLGPLANVTYAARVDPLAPDWTSIWTAVKASGADIVIHVFSGAIGTQLSASFYDNNVEALLCGINVMGQLQTHWASTTGKCEYETFLDFSGTRSPIVPDVTRKFWDNFVGNYTYWPIYPAWGAYDGVYSIAEACDATDTTDPATVGAYLASSSRQGLNGVQRYTAARDILCSETMPWWFYGDVRAMMVQWLDGQKDVVIPRLKTYSKVWALPPSMYSLVEDTNYDQFVGIDDIVFAAEHFGTSPYPAQGYDRWEHVCDVTYDDYCGIDDIVQIASEFGTIYSP